MNASANAVRVAPRPTAVTAEVDDFMHSPFRDILTTSCPVRRPSLPGFMIAASNIFNRNRYNNSVAGSGFKRQITRRNEKINRMTRDFEAVLIDDFVTCPTQHGIHNIRVFVTTIEGFRGNMLGLFFRKPLETVLQKVHAITRFARERFRFPPVPSARKCRAACWFPP